ncbi:hypothetical protein M8494_22590 [Serratia ureilytica]
MVCRRLLSAAQHHRRSACYFNTRKSVEFTRDEYTDIDAQDKFFRQSRSANTPFTDDISYDWSLPFR